MEPLVHRVTARNDAVASENKIHDDAVARRYGFGGGLVPGVSVYAYMTSPAAAQWGPDWVAKGTMSVRLLKPVYDGEQIEVRATPSDTGGLDVVARGPDGEVRASGTATLPDDPSAPPDADSVPPSPVPTPDLRPSPSAAVLDGAVLATIDKVWSAAEAEAFLATIGEDVGFYASLPVAHPGWLIRTANSVLARTVNLGPWIHVATSTSHHGLVTDGMLVSTRARVADVYERRGHRFVELDVLALGDGASVLSALHVAIYEPRPVAAAEPPSA